MVVTHDFLLTWRHASSSGLGDKLIGSRMNTILFRNHGLVIIHWNSTWKCGTVACFMCALDMASGRF